VYVKEYYSKNKWQSAFEGRVWLVLGNEMPPKVRLPTGATYGMHYGVNGKKPHKPT